jgi:hypothetical protein
MQRMERCSAFSLFGEIIAQTHEVQRKATFDSLPGGNLIGADSFLPD